MNALSCGWKRSMQPRYISVNLAELSPPSRNSLPASRIDSGSSEAAGEGLAWNYIGWQKLCSGQGIQEGRFATLEFAHYRYAEARISELRGFGAQQIGTIGHFSVGAEQFFPQRVNLFNNLPPALALLFHCLPGLQQLLHAG